jgi:hypothetical protein
LPTCSDATPLKPDHPGGKLDDLLPWKFVPRQRAAPTGHMTIRPKVDEHREVLMEQCEPFRVR